MKKFFDWVKIIIFFGILFVLYTQLPRTDRQIKNWMRATNRTLYNRLVNADCNILKKELDIVYENSENPEPDLIRFIERRMKLKKCNLIR